MDWDEYVLFQIFTWFLDELYELANDQKFVCVCVCVFQAETKDIRGRLEFLLENMPDDWFSRVTTHGILW